MGESAWSKLHPDIQKRFSEDAHATVQYNGVMQRVDASLAGKLLAQCCRLIGTPLAVHTGRDLPIEVKVYPDSALNGMTWDRFYHFEGKKVNRVKSTKCIRENEGLVEMVGYGFGMHLDVYEQDQTIVFESTRFFWQLGKFKLYIPNLLSPGKTLVRQKALANNQFEFRLDVTHKLLGKVFSQVGVFKAVVN